MLSVAVECDGVCESIFPCGAESFLQRGPLPAVGSQVHYPCAQPLYRFHGKVGAAVIHNYHVRDLLHGAAYHVGDSPGVVVHRYYDAYPWYRTHLNDSFMRAWVLPTQDIIAR